MLRDANKFRRKYSKIPQSEESNENLPLDDSSSLRLDPNRPPLNLIQEPFQRTAQNSIFKRKFDRTPSKNQNRTFSEFRTLEMPKNHLSENEGVSHFPPLKNVGENSGCTPRNYRKANSLQSECSSIQSTRTKSVSKPGNLATGNGLAMSVGRIMNNVLDNKASSAYIAKEV